MKYFKMESIIFLLYLMGVTMSYENHDNNLSFYTRTKRYSSRGQQHFRQQTQPISWGDQWLPQTDTNVISLNSNPPHRFNSDIAVNRNFRSDNSAIIFPDDDRLASLPRYQLQYTETKFPQPWNQPFPLVLPTRRRNPNLSRKQKNRQRQQQQWNQQPLQQSETQAQDQETQGLQSESILQCMENCKTTNEYNPVCGTNGQTFINKAKLICSQSCGDTVQIERIGTCQPLVSVPRFD